MNERVLTRALDPAERSWFEETLAERWPHELLTGRGRVHQPAELTAIVAVRGEKKVGLATYHVEGDLAELVTLDSFVAGAGIGQLLLEAVADAARAAGAQRLLAMVTNDNARGLAYYQRAGFHLTELRAGAMDELRRQKTWIPLTGHDGIRIRDEIDLIRDL